MLGVDGDMSLRVSIGDGRELVLQVNDVARNG